MANRVAGPSAGRRPSSKKKGSTRRKASGGAKKGAPRGAKRAGGPRSRKGWSGPAPAKLVRGSNTTAPSRRQTEPRKEDEGKKGQTRARAPATQQRAQRTAPDKRKVTRARPEEEGAETAQEGPRTYEITMDENLHGPEKMEAFRSKADEMVVGERTVIHHAARYGIVRGMTWTVILSALLFWLPLVGPGIAGYVGGRKAGGPLRGIIAVAIPAMVMFVLLATVNESMDLLPASMTSGVAFDTESIADLPAQTIPLVAGLEQSINAFMTSPPDVMFIMVVFAMVGGALSSLRRREEETVIEKVGIPLGELKERVLREQAEQAGTPFPEPPSRWHPHQAIAGPVAAHDAFNELVEEVAQRVYGYMVSGGQDPATRGTRTGRRRSRKGQGPVVSTGEEGPHYEDMVAVFQAQQAAMAAEASPKARGGRRTRGARAGADAGTATTAPTTVAEAIVGDAEDWEVVNTSRGRRPIRVVRSPAAAAEVAVREHDMLELEARAAPPVVWEEEGPSPAARLPEPPMYVEERTRGILGRTKHRVVYPTAEGPAGLGSPVSPHGGLAGEGYDEGPPVPRHRNYERLPIVGSIYETMSREEAREVTVTDAIGTLAEPTIEDTREASAIANSAARELVEIARFEEGPDMEPEEDDAPPEARRGRVIDEVGELAKAMEEALPEGEEPPRPPRGRSKPRVKSTARQVKHPTGALKSRGHRGRPEAVFEEEEALVGVVKWDGREDEGIEEEDLFNPRHLVDEAVEDAEGGEDDPEAGEGPEGGSDAWAEEERIAALVREREDWDRL